MGAQLEYGSPSDSEVEPFLSEDLEDAIKLEDRSPDSHRSGEPIRRTPVPKAKLASLCGVRTVDPIAFTQIFPYVNEMMEHLHVTDDPSKIGYYSGLVESAFAISQLLAIYQWAKLSDKVGRRPVVLIGIAGVTITTFFLGLSNSFAGVFISRFLGGFFSGNLPVIHSVLGEITDSTNQAVAYSLYGLCYPMGEIIGPLIGGTFSNPVEKFPQWFERWELLKTYPYFLPSFLAALIAAGGFVGGYFFLEESLPSKRRNKNGAHTPQPLASENPQVDASVRYLWSIPNVRVLCISGWLLSFIDTAFNVIFVLFCYSPVESGGLAFSAAEIGYALAVSGIASAVLQLFLMPYLLRRFDHAKLYNLCMAVWPYSYALLPGVNLVARSGLTVLEDGSSVINPHTKTMVWLGIAVILMLVRSAALAFVVGMILVKDSAPDPGSLGATNGLAQFSMCLARAFAPAFASSLFALSVGSSNFFLRYLWVVAMAGISFFSTTYSRQIVEGRKTT